MCNSCVDTPSIFSTAGTAANRIGVLGWILTSIAIAVTAIVAAVLLASLVRSRAAHGEEVQRVRGGVRWIVIGGVIAPAVILAAAFLFSVLTQSALADSPRGSMPTIQVIGHRWWWEVRYPEVAGQTVVTANELHVVAGRRVRLELTSADVIHSFWVPRLAGKTDLIPGQRNTMWMEADRPGTFWGECAEYCGVQHAHMNLVVVAETPDQHDAWLAAQRATAITPADSVSRRGQIVFEHAACASCHTIRGSRAEGRIGPDLTHLESRRTIAAGTFPNTRGNLAGWIANAQTLKPGSGMPTIALPAADSRALLAYLETLR